LPGIAGQEEEYLRDHWPQDIRGDSRAGHS
jgi:hypothetical protein